MGKNPEEDEGLENDGSAALTNDGDEVEDNDATVNPLTELENLVGNAG